MAIALLGAGRAIDVQHSKLTLYVDKQGMFAFMADNHEIEAPIASGSFDADAKTVELNFDAAKIRVLDPKLSEGRRGEVQAAMVSAKVLDVEHYPQITFRTTKVDAADATHWTVTGDLTLHGQTHPQNVTVVETDASHFAGTATIRQSTYGIVPIRIAGGTVAVKDDVRLVFTVTLAP